VAAVYSAAIVRGRLVLFLLAVVLTFVVPVASASAPSPQPFHVESSTLTQSVRRLTWKVALKTPFLASALSKAGRSLCLLIERKNGSTSGRLCVIGPRPGRKSARIVFQKVTRDGPGNASVISATVTRGGARNLTATFLPSAIHNTYTSIRWQVLNSLKAPACAPRKPNRLGCVSLFPARPQLAKLHTPQLVGCTANGPDYVTNGSRSKHEIALTFDDGPWYDTPQFLDILEHYKVPGTFFEIGEQISVYGQGGAVERRMLADGDMVGDHTWNHADVSRGGGFAAGEIGEAAAAIRGASHGFEPCLFRAPYGAVSGALTSEARSMGFTTIEWDVDPTDWARPGTDAIYDRVTSMAQNGSIILQHDGGGDRSETLAALPREIQTFERRGYKFVTVTQMLGQRLIYK
jgi:peptidoglycan/xylan/chitin deacetylase (PgdA/CDA1 family)